MRCYSIFLILTVFSYSVLTFDDEDDFNEPSEYLFEDETGALHEQTPVLESRFSGPLEDYITLYLYTVNNPDTPEQIDVNNFDELTNSSVYDSTKENFFIIHGYLNNYKSDVNVYIRNAIFNTTLDINVFCVDWSGPAGSLWYPNSARAVKDVGTILGNFINKMMDYYNISSSMFKFAGHSLGAHVAGRIGLTMKSKPKYIIGLDPAAPNFVKRSNRLRLDKTDAELVHVIHTNTALYGFQRAIGHADYYPNSGRSQPGCFLNACSHARCYQYLAEAILRGGFKAILCSSYKMFKKGDCKYTGSSYMGNLNIDKKAFGDYYLDTNNEPPFSKHF